MKNMDVTRQLQRSTEKQIQNHDHYRNPNMLEVLNKVQMPW